LRAILFFALAGLAAALWWFFFMRGKVATEDAYVAGNQVRVSPQTQGTVIAVLADNTETVQAGQPLVLLDPADAALGLDSARSQLATAAREISSLLAQKERLKASIRAREAELETVRNDYDRRLRLKPGSSITSEEVERYEIQGLIAQANLEAARAELEAAERALGQGRPEKHPRITEAAVRMRESCLALQRCRIASPVSGKVARRTVQAGSQVSPGSALMLVVPESEIWVEANFKESQLDGLRPGVRVEARADVYGSKVAYRGVIDGLSPGTGSAFSLIPPENATGNWIKIVQRVPVRIILHPEDIRRAPLILGLSCRVEAYPQEGLVEVYQTSRDSYKAEPQDTEMAACEKEIAQIISLNLSLGEEGGRE
jgi:membrane fusion protein (multidrug efflux system)